MTPEQRKIWERRLGTIGAKWTEDFAERVIAELTAATHYRCPVCKCHFTGAPEAAKIHEGFHALKVQAALSVLSLEDRSI